MPNKEGDFIWYELLTTDSDAASEFYKDLIGWEIRDSGMAGMDYRLLSYDGVDVGGLMQLSPEMIAGGGRPGWLGYIGVDDVDRKAADIKAAGGEIHLEPTDIPNVGRFAMVTDPQGIPFYVMRGTSDEVSTAFDYQGVGHVSWNELVTSNLEGALDFYTRQIGWTKGDAMPICEGNEYRFLHQGEAMIGAAMGHTDTSGPPQWTFYWRVPDTFLVFEKAKASGAALDCDPMEVPGGDYVFTGTDPQGARFGICGRKVS
jgi:predicted enzyme related to lactoylglutathione lyase